MIRECNHKMSTTGCYHKMRMAGCNENTRKTGCEWCYLLVVHFFPTTCPSFARCLLLLWGWSYIIRSHQRKRKRKRKRKNCEANESEFSILRCKMKKKRKSKRNFICDCHGCFATVFKSLHCTADHLPITAEALLTLETLVLFLAVKRFLHRLLTALAPNFQIPASLGEISLKIARFFKVF